MRSVENFVGAGLKVVDFGSSAVEFAVEFAMVQIT